MRSGFPDYHQFPDRDHGDESFWPSFTDIMMVITMVFLLVTVMAITNNWKLVTDLKMSIQAERLAAEQALDKEAQNNSLEDQMVMLQKRLVNMDNLAVTKQLANDALQKELTRILAKISNIEKELEASLKTVRAREKQLILSSQQVDSLKTDRDKQLATQAVRAKALSNLKEMQEASQQQVIRLRAALDEKQAELQQVTNSNISRIADLESALKLANFAVVESKESAESLLTNLQERLQQTELTLDSSRESQQVSEKQLETLREEAAILVRTKREEAAAMEALRSEMAQLAGLRDEDITKLQSMKNEFDTLDSKYQKLVRPARSSNGKHVVSVWLSRQTGREVHRIRDGSNDSFATTTRREMKKMLAVLKDKYGKELYVKVIIPENSGLSYSDAWRFTTEMQRAYDYYYQDDE